MSAVNCKKCKARKDAGERPLACDTCRATSKRWRAKNPDVVKKTNDANKAAGINRCKVCLERKASGESPVTCSACSAKNKAYRAKHKERMRAVYRRHNIKTKYGLTDATYSALFESQHGVCAICFCQETERSAHGKAKHLAVDHDHATGRIRALLCTSCNIVLGRAHDNPSILLAAAIYLETHSKNGGV